MSRQPVGSGEQRRERARRAEANGLYSPAQERDNCGVALVADIQGRRTHKIVDQGLVALGRLEHRGAVGADPLTGDGAGILTQIPHRLFADEIGARGRPLPAPGDYAVGQLFFPHDPWTHPARRALVERILEEEDLTNLGWRPVPVDESVLGPLALENAPHVTQVFIGRGDLDHDDFERRLFVTKKRIEREGHIEGLRTQNAELYVCSLSTRTIVYKGLLLPERLARFYPDLGDPRYESAVAIVHQRFSTNTFPSWERAHPYRLIAHNGEINTLRGNVAWMEARERLFSDETFGADVETIRPVLDPGGSDSAMFDNALELLTQTGRTLPHSLVMMIPEAWQKNPNLSPEMRAFWEYHASLMEPWDGPACITFTDGRVAGGLLDRNGLRPARWFRTVDDTLVMASESGVFDVSPARVVEKGRLRPGRMLLIDLEAGRLVNDGELKESLARRRPYSEWVKQHIVRLGELPEPSFQTLPRRMGSRALRRAQHVFGYSSEDLQMLIHPMARTGKEPVGAMGNDAPLAVLSDRPQLLFHYFKQLFAQVTNPPIDPLREELVMSLRTTLGPDHDLFDESPKPCHQLELDAPILTNARLRQIRGLDSGDLRAETVETLWEPRRGAAGLERAIRDLCRRAEHIVREGATILILSDRAHDETRAPIPALLALSAVHHHLIRVGLRQETGLVVESGEPREVMHFALLVGYGAGAINPYLTFETIADAAAGGAGKRPQLDVDVPTAIEQYIRAVHLGLQKVLSKMGISTLQSYRGAQIFEAVGLDEAFVDAYFPHTASRLGGVGIEVIATESKARHRVAHRHNLDAEGAALDPGGQYKWRREGEYHAYNPSTVALMQHAVRSADFKTFRRYTALVDEAGGTHPTLRSLLTFASKGRVPLDDVEPVSEIVKRFRTGAMSFGSISAEAHETLAVAMNRLGGASNTGEGGEDSRRWVPDPNGDSRRSRIKQVASGRFGVTTAYLVQADEIQIKMAQGAKPGEGGQLPGHKVNEIIARTRHSTPGVGLISPPPHHDIYSIEDLAQLIHDLKSANPRARISVKLVSEVGVGTVAAGVAKAKADHILISGTSGGTGASPLSSIKHAGAPWEIGLAETQQVLVMNDLRGRVVLETDGQLKTGRDVIVAALLGAEQFGFGTAALISAGCVLMRVCHLNTCPVGVATQDPVLRERFAGLPEHVMNFMVFIAEEVRSYMAELGFRSMDELIGRSDCLVQREVGHWKAKQLDLSRVLHRVDSDAAPRFTTPQDHGLDRELDAELLPKLAPTLRSGEAVRLSVEVQNKHRSFGARLASELTRAQQEGTLPPLPAGTVRIDARGTGGQSFGAFIIDGMDIHLRGDANDALGKGMSGGRLVLLPPLGSRFDPARNVICGNVALYGATGGTLFACGQAGERFAVRNSGAAAVVEGVGDHGCEYMTGGTVVVLGEVGRNFAAGMSGGVAYVLRESYFEARVNRELVELEPLAEEDVRIVGTLIEEHAGLTGSERASSVLADFRADRFIKVMPREYKRALAKMAEADASSGDEQRMPLKVVHG